MSNNPPSPDGSTPMTVLTFGSALSEISLMAPVVRSATSADLLSPSMISPLVLSRQPCMTFGAGHCLGNGVAGSGGGGGGVEVAGGLRCGSVVNGSDWASLKCAQPVNTSNPAHPTTAIRRTAPRIRMPARLRTPRVGPPGWPP
ncbi:hypothetical protein C1Y40_02783 [Mycobacterium talmoniae]|uniref:Uncharacterized protein n=1 Tax=Mycobacterium talmoniae TaxID=1858794 RepID=A0A2S8BK28_9MYCO|nr:hypothetical protein C1Y40_02783 [Mycobacterium talmoniae]